MKKKQSLLLIFLLGAAILSSVITGVFYEPPTPPSPMPEALASPTNLQTVTLSTPGMVYDGTGKSVGGFKIKADGITIQNCTIYAGAEYSFEVRANNLTVRDCYVYNNKTEGSIFDFVLPNGQAVTNTTVTNLYADGDVGWGVTGRWDGLTMTNVTFLNIGKSSNSGKHAFYFKDVKNGVFENILVKNVWNSCIKIVGQVSNVRMTNTTCDTTGQSKDYGSALMIGEGGDNARTTYISNVVLSGFQAINTYDHDVEVYDKRVALPITINGIYYPSIVTMDLLPVIPVTMTPSLVIPTVSRTSTATHSRTPTRTPTKTPTSTVSPTSTCIPIYAGAEHEYVGSYCLKGE